ncbi:MAG: NAD+ synthase [Desulfobacterota bacterium]|nr:NAD+ synthase [Thermodesulfobacteriota bacterium]
MPVLRVAIAQINSKVGDILGNAQKIASFIEKSKDFGADLVIFPEFSVTGSPAYDLFTCKSFVKEAEKGIEYLLPHTNGIVAVIPSVRLFGDSLFNSAYIISKGGVLKSYEKRRIKRLTHLDETRYFHPGDRPCVVSVGGVQLEILMGEEFTDYEKRKDTPLILVLDSSIYRVGEIDKKREALKKSFPDLHFCYVNLVGGQDEWIFYGGSFVGYGERILSEAKTFEEDLIFFDFELRGEVSLFEEKVSKKDYEKPIVPLRGSPPKDVLEEEILKALILATKDYAHKNGFQTACLGISGGIDSALTAYIASRALGSQNVTGLFMPSRYTAKESYEDAKQLARNLQIELLEVPIDGLIESYFNLLKGILVEELREVTVENIQARIRANLLMAFSNNKGALVLTTSNKSELATGYFTLYGDSAGGFAVLKDVPKTLIYRLCEYVNKKEGRFIIPKRVLEKEPSAELKFNQKDTDELPPYHVLDSLIEEYIEGKMGGLEVENKPLLETVKETLMRFFKNEYKRRQAPCGPTISLRSLGRDSDFPITNLWRYREWSL